MSLGAAQIDRYSRQIILPEVGGRGQERLLGARVLLAGHDDAAVATATLLGRAGVGTLHLVAGPASLPELSPDCRVERIADGVPVPDADVFVDVRGGSTAALGREAARHRRPLVLAVDEQMERRAGGRPLLDGRAHPGLVGEHEVERAGHSGGAGRPAEERPVVANGRVEHGTAGRELELERSRMDSRSHGSALQSAQPLPTSATALPPPTSTR